MTRLPKGASVNVNVGDGVPPQSGTLTRRVAPGDTFARVSIPTGPAWATPRLLLVPMTALVAFNGSTLAPRAREKTNHNQGTERTRRRRKARRKAEKR